MARATVIPATPHVIAEGLKAPTKIREKAWGMLEANMAIVTMAPRIYRTTIIGLIISATLAMDLIPPITTNQVRTANPKPEINGASPNYDLRTKAMELD